MIYCLVVNYSIMSTCINFTIDSKEVSVWINNDIINDICRYLYDKDNILSVSPLLHSLKDKIFYYDQIPNEKIQYLWYIDRFVNIIIGYCFNRNIKDCIPSSVTNLTFGYWFNQYIKDCILCYSFFTYQSASH